MPDKTQSRIYGDKANINENEMKQFWNKRACKYDVNNPFVSIKLGDRNPERAQKWDEYEKDNIIPLLNITFNDTVLDIGCGIGRLADAIIPNCKFYLGTDYAADLVAIAQERTRFPGKDYAFATISLQDISDRTIPIPDGKYSLIIIAGVMGFINDDNICEGLRNVLSVMADSCRICVLNPVGITQRLTLNHFFSDELESEYSVIYRTEEEYLRLMSELSESGFELALRGDIMVDTANSDETKRVFHVFSRSTSGTRPKFS